jgi:multidrug resistance efflux pump
MKQTNNAGMRFDVKIKVFNSMGITRLIELMDLNNQQFIDGDRLVKLGQEKGEEWRTVNPGDLIGEFDYRPAGANIDPAANKQVRREQLSQMMQFLMEAGVPFVNYHELIKEWLESFDIENAQKFIVPKQQWQQQQIMQQQQMNTQNSRDRASQTDQRRAAQAGKGQGINPQQQGPQQERVGGNVR